MRVAGTTPNRPRRRGRRATALLVLAPALVTLGLAAPAHAARTRADDPTATTVAPPATTNATQGRLSTGTRISTAADDPAGLDPDRSGRPG